MHRIGSLLGRSSAGHSRPVRLDFTQMTSLPSFAAFQRGSAATDKQDTELVHYAPNSPRLGPAGLLIEETRTNHVPSTTMAGASAGLLSAGGTLPSGWAIDGSLPNGAIEVIGTGTIDGKSHVDIRFAGVPTGPWMLRMGGFPAVAVADGQSLALSYETLLVDGDLSNLDGVRSLIVFTGGGATHSKAVSADIALSGSASRQSLVALADSAAGAGSIDGATPAIEFDWSSGPVDLTLRIATPQLEFGAYPTSFIANAGTGSATRAADSATIPVSHLGFDAEEGTVYFEGETHYTEGGLGFPRLWQIDDESDGNRVGLLINEPNDALAANTFVNGTGVAPFLVTTYAQGTPIKHAYAWKRDDFAAALNGVLLGSDGTGAVPTGLSMLRLGFAGAGGGQMNGHIKRLVYYPRRLSNSDLSSMTV